MKWKLPSPPDHRQAPSEETFCLASPAAPTQGHCRGTVMPLFRMGNGNRSSGSGATAVYRATKVEAAHCKQRDCEKNGNPDVGGHAPPSRHSLAARSYQIGAFSNLVRVLLRSHPLLEIAETDPEVIQPVLVRW